MWIDVDHAPSIELFCSAFTSMKRQRDFDFSMTIKSYTMINVVDYVQLYVVMYCEKLKKETLQFSLFQATLSWNPE